MDNTQYPIRVLQVVTSMNRGGLETMLMNYYRHMDREKVQFDFLVHREEQADYDDEIENLGGKIHRISRLVPWSKRYLKELEDFFLTHPEYSVVHVHQDCLSAVALKVAKKCGVKVAIAHSHTSNQDKNIKYPIKLFYKRFIPEYADELMACSSAAGEWMFNGAHFTVLKNAIDAGAFSFEASKKEKMRMDLGIPEDFFVIGHIGRFMPPKNHDYILRVFSCVKCKNSKAKLLLIGDGELRNVIKQKSMQLGIADDVLFLGVRSDVADILQAVDLFVLPSKYEGLGIVLIEAQCEGIPCVIADSVPRECEVCSDLITRRSISEDPERWAECILNLKDTSRKSRLTEVKLAGYDIAENAAKLQQFYLEKQNG